MTARRAFSVLLVVVFAAFFAPRAQAQVSLTTLGTPYTQNFDTLATTGTANPWTDNTTIPGWYAQFSATPANPTTYRADAGGSNTGAVYSWGVAGVNPVTERALGSLSSGTPVTVLTAVRFVNNTGATITSLTINYNGEQWRDGGAATPVAQTTFFEYQVGNAGTITDANAPSTGWTSFSSLDITSPTFTNTGAGAAIEGNQAANRTAKAATLTVTVNAGQEIWLRWRDPNDGGNDHGLAVDDLSVTPQGASPNAPVVPTCPATVSTTFGNATTAGVSATDSDGTVTSATITGITPSDPGTITLTGFTPAGGVGGTANATLDVSNTTPAGSYNVTIQWANNDGVPQTANCVVAVNVTAPVVIIPIHDVQGNGTASPLASQTVTVRGVVTLLKSNGFFLQEELADYDADPNTSEGIFVFTSSAPTVAVGDDATVTGTAVEFNNLTEISPVTNVTINSSGNTLPTAITLTAIDLPTTAAPDQPQLEKYEGMRLLAPSLITVAPNDGFFDVDTVLVPQPRPFREPGIPATDPIPPDPTSGLPDPNIPIWDENPERLNVDTNGRAGSTGETLTSNVTLTNVAGPLDFAFGRYRLINEANLSRTADMSAVPVPTPAANEFTIAGYNIENFNNNATQRQKAALTIRDVLLLPDIIGTVEIFDLADLQALATEIQTISGVTYSAHLIEQDGTSEDSDQDVGFLVKTSRVSVTSVTAERAADTYINPNNGLPELLHDRPPLLLTATVDPSGPAPQPVFVIVNHLRSFIDVELVAGEGPRVRAKRKAQAESLADLLNDLQTANPTTPVISVGDYNAFQFNSGYDDSVSVLKGSPTPDDQIVVDQSPDLVNPDYVNLFENVPAAQRYSFIFENTAQSLDHMLVNAAANAINTGIAVARVNSDFPEVSAAVYASNAARPERNSDHDPVVGYFQLPASADVSINKTDNVDPVNAGQNFFYTISVDNNGPDVAENVSWSDTLPAGTTFVSLSSPAGWSCTTPAVGGTGTVTCSTASLAVTNASFTLTVAVSAGLASGTVLSNTADVDSTSTDPTSANDSDTETTTVATSADLQISKTDTPDPVTAGNNLTYQLTLTNNGPSNAASATFSDTLPAGTTFVSLSTTGTWSCTTPAVGATGTISCTNTSFLVTADFFTIVVNVNSNVAAGTILSNTATIDSSTPDPNSSNDDDTADTTVATSADVQVTKTDSPDPVNAGSNITYTITVTNAGPSDAATVTLADTIPADTTFVSLTQSGWLCSTPAVGGTGAVNCSITTLASGASSVLTLVVNVDSSVSTGTIISNTANVTTTTTDPNLPNTATATTTVGSGSADVSVTKTDSPDPVEAGTNLTYTITVNNAGPSSATTVTLDDTLPTGTTFVSLSSPAGWSCATPAVGATGAISCSIGSLVVGNAVFTLTVNVDANVLPGTISNTATVDTATADPNGANDSDTETTTVNTSADLQVTKTDTPDPVAAGANLTYTITVTNAGPSDAATVSLTDTLPANTTFVSLTNPGWSCTTPAVGAAGTVTCNIGSMPVGNAVFTLVVEVDDATPAGTILSNTATVTSNTTDPSTGDESDTTTTTTIVTGSAQLSATKTVTGSFVPGGSITYTVVITNNGTVAQGNNPGDEFVDVLPSSLTLVSASATSGTANANVGTNTVTWNGSIAASASVTITINATIGSVAPGTTISNQGTVNYDSNGDSTNDASAPTDSPSQPGGDDATAFVVAPASHEHIPTLDEYALMALAAILGAIAVLVMKK